MITEFRQDCSGTVDFAGITMPMDSGFAAIAGLIRLLALDGPPVGMYVAHTIVNSRAVCADVPEPKFTEPTPAGVLSELDHSSRHFGVYAAIALDVLSAPSLTRAAHTFERVRDLHAAITPLLSDEWRSTPTTDRPEVSRRFQTRIPSGVVEAIVITSRIDDFGISDRLSYRTGNPLPRYPGAATEGFAIPGAGYESAAAGSVSARHIPQCLWPSVIATIPRHTRKDTSTFGAAMSMAVARIGTFTRWKVIALHLGIPAGKIAGVRAVFASQLKMGTADETIRILDAVVDALTACTPPIDYARRRWVFRDLIRPGRNRFRRACRATGLVLTNRRRRFAGQFLWEVLTGGDGRLRPPEHSFASPNDRSAYARFRIEEGRDLEDFFAREAERHLLLHRIDEPISWQPFPAGGPGGTWTSVAEPPVRLLSGWNSPSRSTSMRRTARDHRAQAWSRIVGDDHLNLDTVGTVIRAFPPADLDNLDLDVTPDQPLPTHPAVVSEVRITRHLAGLVRQLDRRQAAYNADIVLSLGGPYWCLGGTGEVLRREIAHCWPPEPDDWDIVDPGVAPPSRARSHQNTVTPSLTGTES